MVRNGNAGHVKRGRWADAPAILFGRSRLGAIKVSSLIEFGMDSSTIYRRCLPGGPWRRLLPGVVLMQNSAPSDDQLVAAAQLYAGPSALLTGLEACRRHGLRLPRNEDVHMLLPHGRKLRSCEFVTIERTHRMPAAVVRGGVPLAPLIRATLDAARRIRATEPVATLLIEAIQRGNCSPAALARELELGTPRGTAIPRRLLAEIEQLRSVAELHAYRVGKQLVVPPTHWNVEIRTAAGDYVGRPDAYWDDVGLAWEVDSYDWHYSAQGYAKTLRRNTRYAGAGVLVVQTLPSRLLRDPAAVIADLEGAYAAAAARPRPAVVVVPPGARAA